MNRQQGLFREFKLELLMGRLKRQKKLFGALLLAAFNLTAFSINILNAQEEQRVMPGNFGLPGIIDLPTAKHFSDGELIFTHQNHEYLFMSGISFQALPRLGVSFRYGGQGRGGAFAQNRINWDRSFDAHISLTKEGKYLPAISIGLRDFIGTGWYSSEYLVGTKSFGELELTAGLGFGRLAGRDTFSNPLSYLSPRFDRRDKNNYGKGGTLGTINWFHGDAAGFFGFRYQIGKKITFSTEYTSDPMTIENSYLKVKSPWNLGLSYQLNDYLNFSTQYLYGSQISITAQVDVNPNRPPLLGGKELAPVPMRLRVNNTFPATDNNEAIINKVLIADRFKVHRLNFQDKSVSIVVTNTKFRSTAQAVGRVASTLQRFTSDNVKTAFISFHSLGLIVATYRVDLEQVTKEQFYPLAQTSEKPAIVAVDLAIDELEDKNIAFIWGIGPYITHRLFNPDLPLSAETGVEFEAGYQFTSGLKFSGVLRKSVLTNLTDNKRRSNSVLPHVHSDWPLYDFAGQSGHIHSLTLSKVSNLGPGLYGRVHAGFLEPFFAGVGGEILFKPSSWPIGIGFDIHRVQKRSYDMRLDLLDYQTTVGHLSFYYDDSRTFNIEINAGKYLAGDWGATITAYRQFGSGWEVGGYATLTDVPFDTFGEGSFDKAIYLTIPIDWFISSPSQTKRRLTLRPITRDGGANLTTARKLNRHIRNFQNQDFQRELGRLWK